MSSQCAAILNTTCDKWNSTVRYSGFDVDEINCTKERSGVDFKATFFPVDGLTYFMDYHRFANETERPFTTEWHRVTNESLAVAANLSREDGLTTFKNPWKWVSAADGVNSNYAADFWHNKTHPYLWEHTQVSSYTMLLHCNSTGTYCVQATS